MPPIAYVPPAVTARTYNPRDPLDPRYVETSVKASRKKINGQPAFVTLKEVVINPHTGEREVTLKSSATAPLKTVNMASKGAPIADIGMVYNEFSGKRAINSETTFTQKPRYSFVKNACAYAQGKAPPTLRRYVGPIVHKHQQQPPPPKALMYKDVSTFREKLFDRFLASRGISPPERLVSIFEGDYRTGLEKLMGIEPYAAPDKVDARAFWEKLLLRPLRIEDAPHIKKANVLLAQYEALVPGHVQNHVRTILPRNQRFPWTRPLATDFEQLPTAGPNNPIRAISNIDNFNVMQQVNAPMAHMTHLTQPNAVSRHLKPLHKRWLTWINGGGDSVHDFLKNLSLRNPAIFSALTPLMP